MAKKKTKLNVTDEEISGMTKKVQEAINNLKKKEASQSFSAETGAVGISTLENQYEKNSLKEYGPVGDIFIDSKEKILDGNVFKNIFKKNDALQQTVAESRVGANDLNKMMNGAVGDIFIDSKEKILDGDAAIKNIFEKNDKLQQTVAGPGVGANDLNKMIVPKKKEQKNKKYYRSNSDSERKLSTKKNKKSR